MENYKLSFEEVHSWVKDCCTHVSPDNLALLEEKMVMEHDEAAKAMLKSMIENVRLADKGEKPVCQSPGFPTVYVRFSNKPEHVNLVEQVTKYLGPAFVQATNEGYLRPSIVHPLTRKNPGDNSGRGVPNIEYQFRPNQEYVEVIISCKGCGAELGNVFKTMTTAQLGKNLSGLKKLVYDTVINAGGMPCPPSTIGIGIGGQMDIASKLSREAVSTRDWRDSNPDKMLDSLEKELLENINKLGLGPAGIGGDTSCLAVKIGMADTHTAICPVAINFHCWVARRIGIRLYPNGKREFLFGK